jgi:hypothetical protein
MAVIDRIEGSDFEPSNVTKVFSDNSGGDITTEHLISSLNKIEQDLESGGFTELLKESPVYIQKKE